MEKITQSTTPTPDDYQLLEKRLADAEAELRSLKAELEVAHSGILEQDITADRNTWRKACKDAQAQRDDLNTALKCVNEECISLISKNRNLKGDNVYLESENAKTKERLDADLVSERNRWRLCHDKCVIERDQMKVELSVRRDGYKVQHKHIASLRDDLKGLGGKYEDLKARYDESLVDFKGLMRENGIIITELEVACHELKQLRDTRDKWEAEREELTAKNKVLQEGNDNYFKLFNQLKAENDKLTTEGLNLKKQGEALQEDLAALEKIMRNWSLRMAVR